MGCQTLPYPCRGSLESLGWGLGLVVGLLQVPYLPHSFVASGPPPACAGEEAGTPGPFSLGSLTATTAALLAFLRVLIGQGTQPRGPLSPEMS